MRADFQCRSHSDLERGAALALQNVSFQYGLTVPVLDNVTWHARIQPGEILVLLGRSGSGKTTILRLLSGLLAPSAGSIFLDEAEVTTVPPHQRRIVLMFQERTLFSGSVRSNLLFPLHAQGIRGSQAEQKAIDLLEMADLRTKLNADVAALSGGERQRVELLRALAADPRLLLLDEPFSSLDAAIRPAFMREVREWIRSRGVRTLVVTHDPEECYQMADLAAVVHDHRIGPARPPRELYEDPDSIPEAGSLGEINILTMNSMDRAGGEQIDRVALKALRYASEAGATYLGVRPVSVKVRSFSADNQGEIHLSAIVRDIHWTEQGYRIETSVAGKFSLVILSSSPLPDGQATVLASVRLEDFLMFDSRGYRIRREVCDDSI